MLKLEKQLFDRIVDLLATNIGNTIVERQGWIAPVFSSYVTFYHRIDWQGSARDFSVNLITHCVTYGTIDGEQALVLLLKSLCSGVGQDQQAIITDLIIQLNQIITLPDVQPYRSLEVFGLEHADFFFGRQAMVDKLITTLCKTNFIALVGSSGSGKSSLVRAGLLAALQNNAIPGSSAWHVKLFRPDENPLFSLYAALIDFIEPQMTERERVKEANAWSDDLAAGNIDADETFKIIRRKHPKLTRLLLIADQFEETFTLSSDNIRQQYFLDTLLTAGQHDWVTFLFTLRADFFGHILEHERFSQQVDTGLVSLIPMTSAERRSAIEQPALLVNRTFEDGLVERILDDVSSEPGVLSLLEFALTELWKHQNAEGVLTHSAYEHIGRVDGAISQYADSIFNQFEVKQQQAVAAIFTRLVRVARPDEGIQDTKQRVNLADFAPTVQLLIGELSHTRLLVTDHNESLNQNTVEIAHESLIRKWPRFQAWLDYRRDQLILQRNFRDLTRNWIEVDCDRSTLLRGRQLKRFATLEESELSTDERLYLQLSKRRYHVQLLGSSLIIFIAIVFIGASIVRTIQQATSEWKEVTNAPDDPIQSIVAIPHTDGTGFCVGTTNEGVHCNRSGLDTGWTGYEGGLDIGKSTLLIRLLGRMKGDDKSDLTRAMDFVKVDPVNPDFLYAFERTNEIRVMNYVSSTLWQSLGAEIADDQCERHLVSNKEFEVYDGSIVAACYGPDSKSYLFIGQQGKTEWQWSTYTYPLLPSKQIHSIYLHPDDVIYMGTEDGVYVTERTLSGQWDKLLDLPYARLLVPNPISTSRFFIATFDRNEKSGGFYAWTPGEPLHEPLGVSIRELPLALTVIRESSEDWTIYLLLENGDVLVTKRNGQQYTIAPYPSFFLFQVHDLLAVKSQKTGLTQLLLAHDNGLFSTIIE